MAVYVSLLVVASWTLYTDAGDPGISVVPSRDQTVAITSDENVTYECMVDGGRSVFWKVQNNPLEGDHISEFEAIGIYKQDSPQGNSSVLIVSHMGRETYRNNGQNVKIQCRGFNLSPPISGFSDVFCIITYDRPETPRNLMLTASDGNITLSWSRPFNIPQGVSVSYIVEVNSTMRSNVTYERVRTLSTSEIVPEDAPNFLGCETFQFLVTASNEAGDSNPARIEETIPISPDINSISSSLSIDAVQRVNQSVSIAVSFKPANTCSENFPITNYSVNLDGLKRITFNSSTSSSRGRIPVLLNTSQVSELVPDSRYTISVTACIEITCRESEAKQVYTTDVQNATVTFFGTQVFLTCTFANRSSARGCIVRFTLSSNRTEQLNITRAEAKLCSMVANQLIAYDRVEVLDWEADGNEGTLSIRVQPLEAVDEQSFTTSCPSETALSGGAISATVLGVFLALGFAITVVTILIIVLWKTHKIPPAAEAPVFRCEEDSIIVILPDATEEDAGLSVVAKPSGNLRRHPVPTLELGEVNLEDLEEPEDNVFTPLLSAQPSATLILDESDPAKNMKLKVSRKCIQDAITHAKRKLSEGGDTKMKNGHAVVKSRSISLPFYSQVVPMPQLSVPDAIKEVDEAPLRSSSSPVQ